MAVGQIAEFNLWSHKKTKDTINSETCGAVGNVVNWNTLQEQGRATKNAKALPGCGGNQ